MQPVQRHRAGCFVTFEGPEGSGKSTAMRAVAAALAAEWRVVVTREPGGTPLGEQLRDTLLNSSLPIHPRAEALLMSAARAQHVESVLRPALQAPNALVLCDRYVDSTLAYQGAGRGLCIDELLAVQRVATDGLVPDITILLDVPIEVGLQRRARDGDGNRMDAETRAFHGRVAEWYRATARSQPERWVIVDGMQPPQAVCDLIVAAIRARCGVDRAG